MWNRRGSISNPGKVKVGSISSFSNSIGGKKGCKILSWRINRIVSLSLNMNYLMEMASKDNKFHLENNAHLGLSFCSDNCLPVSNHYITAVIMKVCYIRIELLQEFQPTIFSRKGTIQAPCEKFRLYASFTGLHQKRVYTHSGTASPKYVHQILLLYAYAYCEYCYGPRPFWCVR